MSLPFTGALLGHLEFVTANRYIRLISDPFKVAANTVDTRIAEALKTPPKTRGKREVVKLTSKA